MNGTLKQKLELTWIGKENRPRLEPRILLEDPEKSYHAPHRVTDHDLFDNRLIFGDNLLALKSLEQEFTGKIKCIYIDPPFNTGSAFEHYDDGLSTRSGCRDARPTGTAYGSFSRQTARSGCRSTTTRMRLLKVLMDEVFGDRSLSPIVVWQKVVQLQKNRRNPFRRHDSFSLLCKNR